MDVWSWFAAFALLFVTCSKGSSSPPPTIIISKWQSQGPTKLTFSSCEQVRTIRLVEGHSYQLQCQQVGATAGSLQWLHAESSLSTLSSSPVFVESTSSEMPQLIIMSFSHSRDGGMYNCTGNGASASILISAGNPVVIPAAELDYRRGNLFFNSRPTLTMFVDGEPAIMNTDYRWFFNGNIFVSNSSIIVETTQLVLPSILGQEHSGNYTLRVNNSVGVASGFMNLIVTFSQVIEIIHTVGQLIPIGTPVTVRCIKFVPGTAFGWLIHRMGEHPVFVNKQSDFDSFGTEITYPNDDTSIIHFNATDKRLIALECRFTDLRCGEIISASISNITVLCVPDPPYNLSYMVYGDIINTSWILHTLPEVRVIFHLSLLFHNPSKLKSQRVNISDVQSYDFSLEGLRSCDYFTFCVRGSNVAGLGNESCINGNLFYIPTAENIHYSISKDSESFALTVTVMVNATCLINVQNPSYVLEVIGVNDSRISDPDPPNDKDVRSSCNFTTDPSENSTDSCACHSSTTVTILTTSLLTVLLLIVIVFVVIIFLHHYGYCCCQGKSKSRRWPMFGTSTENKANFELKNTLKCNNNEAYGVVTSFTLAPLQSNADPADEVINAAKDSTQHTDH